MYMLVCDKIEHPGVSDDGSGLAGPRPPERPAEDGLRLMKCYVLVRASPSLQRYQAYTANLRDKFLDLRRPNSSRNVCPPGWRVRLSGCPAVRLSGCPAVSATPAGRT